MTTGLREHAMADPAATATATVHSRTWALLRDLGVEKAFGDFLGAHEVPALEIAGLKPELIALGYGYGVDAIQFRTAQQLRGELASAIADLSGPRLIVVDIEPGERLEH